MQTNSSLPPHQPNPHQTGFSPQPSSHTVLVVEDDGPSANALVGILRRLGHEVTSVGTVRDAIAALPQKFDYIILDLMLPDGTGAAVLKRVRELNLSSLVCVVTAANDSTLLQSVRDLSPQCILRKPIDLTQLLNGMKLMQ